MLTTVPKNHRRNGFLPPLRNAKKTAPIDHDEEGSMELKKARGATSDDLFREKTVRHSAFSTFS